jgi:hypothetical protein
VDILAHFSQFGAIDFATIAKFRDDQNKIQLQQISKEHGAATAGGGDSSGTGVVNRFNSRARHVTIFYDNT